jgi:hypothetical protein
MKTIFGAAIALMAFTAAASAMDCEKEFRVRVDRMMAKPTVPTGDMIEMTRWSLQGYDACMKGDKKTATEFFEKAGKFSG